LSFQQDEKGNKRWTVKGQYHREDGPAIEWVDGTKFWYQNGKKHRLHGPAIEWPNGNQEYYLHGNAFNKEDYLSLMASLAKKEPFIISGNTETSSVEYQNGITSYVLNGKLHREDGPAREYANGTKEWWFHGELHREDGPAVEGTDGHKEWWVNYKLHREGGPAIECVNGNKKWYLHNELHRADGPAVDWADGFKQWWIHGENYSEQDWNIAKKKLSIEASSNKKKTTSSLPKAVKVTNIKKKSVTSKNSADNKKLVDSTQPMMTIDEAGTKCWKLNDQLHREDGPALEYINGAKWWYRHGDLHREDGPAIEYANGDTSWYLNNKLHREDGPALESAEGLKFWYLQGNQYTEAGWKKKVSAMKKKDIKSKTASHEATDSTQPVMEVDNYGIKRWKLNGRLHREDGPAVESINGNKEWYCHGQLHRVDGPAIEWYDGDKWWYLKGKKYTEAGWKKQVSSMKKRDVNSKTVSHEANDPTQQVMEVVEDGTKYWKLNGQLHREDGPAIEWFNGRKDWYLHDKLHREDGPALEYTDGSKFWYLHGQCHRVDGPAIEWTDGDKYWYLHGKLHRDDGPAIEWCNGDKKWFLQGKEYTEEEYGKKLFPAVNTIAKPADSAWQHLTSDLSHGTFRVAAKTIPKTARTALLAFLKTKKVKKSWLLSAEEMMSTELGLAFIQQVLAWSFRSLPQLKEDPRATALANEWAIDSVAIIGNEVTQELAAYFAPIISQVMELPSSNIRVSPLTSTDRSLEEEEIETMETLQQQATS
jgi:hypothetical protein